MMAGVKLGLGVVLVCTFLISFGSAQNERASFAQSQGDTIDKDSRQATFACVYTATRQRQLVLKFKRTNNGNLIGGFRFLTVPAGTNKGVNFRVTLSTEIANLNQVEVQLELWPTNGSTSDAISRVKKVFDVSATSGGGSGGCTPKPSEFPGKSISTLNCKNIMVDLPFNLNFNGKSGGLKDSTGVGTGFTAYVPADKGDSYQRRHLTVRNGALVVTSRAGTWGGKSVNMMANPLSVGLPLPNRKLRVRIDFAVPKGLGGDNERLCLFLGATIDDYVQICLISKPNGLRYLVEKEENGKIVMSEQSKLSGSLPGNRKMRLQLMISAFEKNTVVASYALGNGGFRKVVTTNVKGLIVSKDQATIDPDTKTRSLCGFVTSAGKSNENAKWVVDDFEVVRMEVKETPAPTKPPGEPEIDFDLFHLPVTLPVSLVWTPDETMLVLTSQSTVLEFKINAERKRIISRKKYNLPLQDRLSLGITVDPDWAKGQKCIWVSHSKAYNADRKANSGSISRFCGNNFQNAKTVIWGLPTSDSAHATNQIKFMENGSLLIAQGGNTGAGGTAFQYGAFYYPEQPLSAAVLIAPVQRAGFKGNCTPNQSERNLDETRKASKAKPNCDVEVFASGLRNIWDFDFHPNGRIYATDNAVGSGRATHPKLPKGWKPGDDCNEPITRSDDLSKYIVVDRPDVLLELRKGRYYGHSNPSRNECIRDAGNPTRGVDARLAGPPSERRSYAFEITSYPVGTQAQGNEKGLFPYKEPLLPLGLSKSANGIIAYRGNAFCGAMKGDLLVAYYSVGDQIKRFKLNNAGTKVVFDETLRRSTKSTGGEEMNNPLSIAQDDDGNIYVAEYRNARISVFVPKSVKC
ncbi:hypothetical protein NDN08_002200 [Rhodosorus marinus]|uniref:Glucose/Sorbosone dehydrogenase domain-containing protein n=1 Tax=Rhodosorus marinus TaxID=101924 RepID=A0AAV8UT09_9RHOD|nr:hypothetical protein NDN08_002200 [Rhodosorus marinus]